MRKFITWKRKQAQKWEPCQRVFKLYIILKFWHNPYQGTSYYRNIMYVGLSLTGGPSTRRSLFSFSMPCRSSSSLFFIPKFASDYVFAIPQWGQWQVPKILKGKSRKGRQAILMHNPKNKSINDPSLIGNQVYTRQFRLSFFFVVSY